MREPISLQEFMIEARSLIRNNRWSLRQFVWHTIHFIYSQCDPEDFLWFLREVQRRRQAKPFKLENINGEPVWQLRNDK